MMTATMPQIICPECSNQINLSLITYLNYKGLITCKDCGTIMDIALSNGMLQSLPILKGKNPIKIEAISKRQLSKLIDIDFSDIFYNELRDEINGAYQMGLFTSVMLLSRKLFENLIIEILRIKYPPNVPSNLELYFIKNEKRFQNFTILLKNIEDRKGDFTVDEHIITEIISLIKPFRKSANLNTHSIIIVSNEKGILDFQIPHISALLFKLLSNIKRSV